MLRRSLPPPPQHARPKTRPQRAWSRMHIGIGMSRTLQRRFFASKAIHHAVPWRRPSNRLEIHHKRLMFVDAYERHTGLFRDDRPPRRQGVVVPCRGNRRARWSRRLARSAFKEKFGHNCSVLYPDLSITTGECLMVATSCGSTAAAQRGACPQDPIPSLVPLTKRFPNPILRA